MSNRTTPIRDEAALSAEGAQAFGSPIVEANPSAVTLTATGNYPARLSTGGPQPRLWRFKVTSAAAVVLTARATPTASVTVDGYIPGDVIETYSDATLANTVTISDGSGPTTRGVMPTTANLFQSAQIRWDGTNWLRVGSGQVPVA